MDRCEGAGIAGLACARELENLGHTVTVLEARERVGGRCFTVQFGSKQSAVDLGAGW